MSKFFLWNPLTIKPDIRPDTGYPAEYRISGKTNWPDIRPIQYPVQSYHLYSVQFVISTQLDPSYFFSESESELN